MRRFCTSLSSSVELAVFMLGTAGFQVCGATLQWERASVHEATSRFRFQQISPKQSCQAGIGRTDAKIVNSHSGPSLTVPPLPVCPLALPGCACSLQVQGMTSSASRTALLLHEFITRAQRAPESILHISATVPTTGMPGLFPLIRDLSVIVDDLRWATAFLDHISSSSLDSIRLLCHGLVIPPRVFDILFPVIASRQWRLALQRLTINCSYEQPPCNLSQSLRLLLPLPALAVLLMAGWSSIIVDDRTLDAMASAWPKLVNLNLACTPGPSLQTHPEYLHVIPQATLAGLVPLAYRCRYLQSIDLAIDVDAIIYTPDRDGFPPPRPILPTESQVIMLHVGWAGPPRDPMRAAILLSEIFPRLLTVQYFQKDEEDDRTTRGWSALLWLLYRFKLIRFQERRWAHGERLYSVLPQRDWGF
ncbi:hypothetical protein C8T65DRAFT_834185 [Cerioporus squamosus]|nr:hypothetical protein C8T65DRAFT_834185 [Cerioporus squamosus]